MVSYKSILAYFVQAKHMGDYSMVFDRGYVLQHDNLWVCTLTCKDYESAEIVTVGHPAQTKVASEEDACKSMLKRLDPVKYDTPQPDDIRSSICCPHCQQSIYFAGC